MSYEITKYGFTPDFFNYSSMIRGMCREGMCREGMLDKIFRILEENDDILNIDHLYLDFAKLGEQTCQ